MIGPGEDQRQTIMLRDGPDAGRVAWIPPTYIDPDQQPRINRAHHVDVTVEAIWQRVINKRQAALDERERSTESRQLDAPPPAVNDHADRDDSCEHLE